MRKKKGNESKAKPRAKKTLVSFAQHEQPLETQVAYLAACVTELKKRLSSAESALAQCAQTNGEFSQRLAAIESVLVVDGSDVRLHANGKLELGAAVHVAVEGSLEVNGSSIALSAGTLTVDTGMARFSGVVQCDALITNSVVSSSYTPGAGNIG